MVFFLGGSSTGVQGYQTRSSGQSAAGVTAESDSARKSGHSPDQIGIGFPLRFEAQEKQYLAAMESLTGQFQHLEQFVHRARFINRSHMPVPFR